MPTAAETSIMFRDFISKSNGSGKVCTSCIRGEDVLAQIVHAVCLIINALFSVPPEWEDEETLMLRDKWGRGR